jgi:hypothetical protein
MITTTFTGSAGYAGEHQPGLTWTIQREVNSVLGTMDPGLIVVRFSDLGPSDTLGGFDWMLDISANITDARLQAGDALVAPVHSALSNLFDDESLGIVRLALTPVHVALTGGALAPAIRRSLGGGRRS